MDDNAPKENPPAEFNKLDLSQLQGFSFGTQWTQEKPSAPERTGREGGDRPRREGGGTPPDRRDRRTFRRPSGGAVGEPAGSGGGAAEGGGSGGERREYPGDRRPRREGEFRGGPRREGGHGGPRHQHGGHGYPRHERGPYESPYYTVTFYPEDTSFNTLVQTIRKSCRTVELFEIARTVVAKPDRFVVVVAHKQPPGTETGPAARGPGATEPAAQRTQKPVFYISVPDGIPFETDDAAVAHVMSKHLDKFFDTAEVEVEPPKGNFQVINKCGITGELLGPPNYHRYNQIVQQHYAAKIAPRMGFEAFRSRIETIRDPEVVNQWLAKMRKTVRYTSKLGPKPASAATEASAEGEAASAASETVNTTPTFDTLEDARLYLLTQARDKVVRTAETARFHGKLTELMPPGEIRHAIEGALERQRRFPLDTANALRGRLRREHFTIFKKGSKGVSYVCAVKRKFRVPGQTFADSIGALISFIEANPMIRASELPARFLGIQTVPAPATPPAAPEGAPAGEAPKVESTLTLDDRARISRMQGDLMWLVREGYVTEFIDGRLFAPPPMVEARKKEIESEEHDPENFPEPPPSESSAGSPPAEAPAAPEPAGVSEPATGTAEPPAAAKPAPTGTEPAPAADAAPSEAEPAPSAGETPAGESVPESAEAASPTTSEDTAGQPEASAAEPVPAEEPKPGHTGSGGGA